MSASQGKSLTIGIVAGEVSGDTLGAGLIRELKVRYPGARFIGICGEQMQAEGGESLFPMERLSVMGLVEVLGRLRELFGIRDALLQRFTEEKIDLFLGIDAPDFNLRLSALLKPQGIATVQYVSPSVWAWRQGRVEGIRAAIDLVLCLLPFERAFYDAHDVRAAFVGHPLADALPPVNDTATARAALGLAADAEYVALLPGSRGGEVARIGPGLFAAARRIRAQRPQARFIIPAINEARRADIERLLGEAGLEAQVFAPGLGAGVGRMVMAAADVVVLASGTATLEAMLLQKPMVVAYRLHWLTFLIVRLMVRSRFVSLPNLLAGEALVPELLQRDANPEAIARETLRWLAEPAYRDSRVARFAALHASLRLDANVKAAEAIAQLLRDRERPA